VKSTQEIPLAHEAGEVRPPGAPGESPPPLAAPSAGASRRAGPLPDRAPHQRAGEVHWLVRHGLLVAGVALVLLILAGLALHVPGADSVGSNRLTAEFVAVLGVAGIVYLCAVALVLRRPSRVPASIVLLIALAMRIPPLLAPPFLSSDMYRYIWDGRVQTAGVNPYRYLPADPALQSLRDRAIFPHINRAATARTIYPPMAQLVFRAVVSVSGSVFAMKLAMVAFEALACWAMLRVLVLARRPPQRVLIYAWNPLAAWTFAGNGHVDAIAIGLLAGAFWLRARRRDGLTGIALGAAVLVKYLPAAVAPALWQRERPWRTALAALGVIAGLYLCYLGAGRHVLGFLPGYFGEEDLTQGSGIWLLAGIDLVIPRTPLMVRLYAAIAGLGFATLALWIAFRARPSDPAADVRRVCGDAAVLAAAITVASSPHYPWYFVWLALPCCVSARASIIWLGVAPLLLYLDPWHERFFWPCLVYGPAIALTIGDCWRPALRRALDVTSASQGTP
jgi:alpha-1,6-mannosyltransferase